MKGCERGREHATWDWNLCLSPAYYHSLLLPQPTVSAHLLPRAEEPPPACLPTSPLPIFSPYKLGSEEVWASRLLSSCPTILCYLASPATSTTLLSEGTWRSFSLLPSPLTFLEEFDTLRLEGDCFILWPGGRRSHIPASLGGQTSS